MNFSLYAMVKDFKIKRFSLQIGHYLVLKTKKIHINLTEIQPLTIILLPEYLFTLAFI